MYTKMKQSSKLPQPSPLGFLITELMRLLRHLAPNSKLTSVGFFSFKRHTFAISLNDGLVLVFLLKNCHTIILILAYLYLLTRWSFQWSIRISGWVNFGLRFCSKVHRLAKTSDLLYEWQRRAIYYLFS